MKEPDDAAIDDQKKNTSESIEIKSSDNSGKNSDLLQTGDQESPHPGSAEDLATFQEKSEPSVESIERSESESPETPRHDTHRHQPTGGPALAGVPFAANFWPFWPQGPPIMMPRADAMYRPGPDPSLTLFPDLTFAQEPIVSLQATPTESDVKIAEWLQDNQSEMIDPRLMNWRRQFTPGPDSPELMFDGYGYPSLYPVSQPAGGHSLCTDHFRPFGLAGAGHSLAQRANDRPDLDVADGIGYSRLVDHNNSWKDDRKKGVNFRRTRSQQEREAGYKPTLRDKKRLFSRPRSSLSSMQGHDPYDFIIILKIVFFDIVFSLVDHASDFLQGFNLLMGNYLMDETKEWSFYNIELYWKSRGIYGAAVLLLNWIPGIVAVIHLLAHYREEFSHPLRKKSPREAKIGDKKDATNVKDYEVIRREIDRKRKQFFTALVVVVFMYPLVPAMAYGLLLWRWNMKLYNPRLFYKTEQYAMVAHCITGGFEAPAQLILNIWLIMKGIIENPLEGMIELQLPKDRFGNTVPWPAIPMLSMLLSFISILTATMRLNVPVPYTLAHSSLASRMKAKLKLVLGFLPFFVVSSVFRVLGIAFIWIYLDLYSFIPLILIFFGNVTIGYSSLKNFDIKQNDAQLHEEMKWEKIRCFNTSIWLNSFIGMFVPCCYTEGPNFFELNYLTEDHLKRLEKIRNSAISKVLFRQSVFGTIIIGVVVVISSLLVNVHQDFFYHENNVSNISFNLICILIWTLGVICLLLAWVGFDVIKLMSCTPSEDTSSKSFKITIRNRFGMDTRLKTEQPSESWTKFLAVSLTATILVASPVVFASIYQAQIPKDHYFAILHSKVGQADNELVLFIFKLFKIGKTEGVNIAGVHGVVVDFKSKWEEGNREPAVIFINTTDLESMEKIHKIKNNLNSRFLSERNITGIVIIENWQNRGSSGFPAVIYQNPEERKESYNTSTFLDLNKDFPVFSIKQKDKNAVISYNESLGMKAFYGRQMRVFPDSLDNILKEDPNLFVVDCDDTKCVDLIGNNTFLDKTDDRANTLTRRRMIHKKTICFDKGLECAELERFKIRGGKVNGHVAMTCASKPNYTVCESSYASFRPRKIQIEDISCCTASGTTIFYPEDGCKNAQLDQCFKYHGGERIQWFNEGECIRAAQTDYIKSRYCKITSTCALIELRSFKCNGDQFGNRTDTEKYCDFIVQDKTEYRKFRCPWED